MPLRVLLQLLVILGQLLHQVLVILGQLLFQHLLLFQLQPQVILGQLLFQLQRVRHLLLQSLIVQMSILFLFIFQQNQLPAQLEHQPRRLLTLQVQLQVQLLLAKM